VASALGADKIESAFVKQRLEPLLQDANNTAGCGHRGMKVVLEEGQFGLTGKNTPDGLWNPLIVIWTV
jgi:hypothetical protein